MRRAIFLAASIVVAAAAAFVLLVPSRSAAPAHAEAWRGRHVTVAGAFHVHTSRSNDSSGSIDAAAAAAARAGLQFVVATEHGDGTRPPLPAAYRAGVLWMDGVEISTTDGHYATFGMRQSPYPLAGDARDVAEDVERLGGTGVAAHGDSPKSEAQWRDWSAPVDGVEWLNLDSVWRDAGAFRLARALFTYWFHPSATLDSLASRPDASLAHLDAIAKTRRIFTIAASDAHGRTIPSYAACFGAFSTRVELEHGLTGDAAQDAHAITMALRAGHHYTSVDAIGRATGFEFSARRGNQTVSEGDMLPEGDPITFDVHVDGPPGARAVLLRDGVPIEDSRSPQWSHGTEGVPAEYRVEVTLPSSPGKPPLPWIVSNPIYVGPHERPAPAAPQGARIEPSAPLAWHVEQDPTTKADVAGSGSSVQLNYQLGAGAPANQFAAAAAPAPANLADASGVKLTVRADRPLRFSFELRASRDRRWERSVYADTSPREVVIPFDEMRPVQADGEPRPPLGEVEALLIIGGISHAQPGTQAHIAVSDIALEKF